MSPLPTEVIPIHDSGKDRIAKYASHFTEVLTLQSKIMADASAAPLVLSSHVDTAYNQIRSHRQPSMKRDLLLVLGSTAIGAFLQGFIDSLLEGSLAATAIWAVVGIVGVALMVTGLFTR